MSDRRRVILSIHGIRTEGEWQEDFRNIFDPHYRFVPFKYGEFRNSLTAVLWLGLELLAIFAGLLLLLFSWTNHWLQTVPAWCAALFLIAVLVLACNLIAEQRRDQVVYKFARVIDTEVKLGRDPHVIAHSLGSFIVGRLLRRYTDTRFDQIVLMGCVLSRHYDWQTLMGRFELVRNETGYRDWVAGLAAILSPFIHEMGTAGRHGFLGAGELVRDFGSLEHGQPWRPCVANCICGHGAIPSPTAKVLNIANEEINHNDLTAVPIRARRVWLPVLWHLPPTRYREFVDLCQRCGELEGQEDWEELTRCERLLSSSCWIWSKGSLAACVAGRLGADAVNEPRLVHHTIRYLHRTVAIATSYDATAQQQRYLHPELALQLAINQARELPPGRPVNSLS